MNASNSLNSKIYLQHHKSLIGVAKRTFISASHSFCHGPFSKSIENLPGEEVSHPQILRPCVLNHQSYVSNPPACTLNID